MHDVKLGNEALRVILVGPTGLDGSLRGDPGVELIRARDALDAIGELADPLDASSPGRAVVIVDPRAEPAERGPEGLAEFLAGLRRVDPEVRVLRLARQGEPLPAGYDGQVEAGVNGGSLRACLEGPGAPEAPAERVEVKPALNAQHPDRAAPRRPDVGEPTQALGVASLGSPPEPSFVAGGELSLLELIRRGSPVQDEAVGQIRARPGFADVRFVPESGPSESGAHSTASVTVDGRRVGELRSRALPPRALTPAASWLGAWLELEREQERLREMAFRDPLTGAWNRRYFDEFLPRAIDEARRHRRALTLLYFDIDDFKRFNDRHGHAAGDEILAECVRLLHSAVRPTDKVCRVGGDEFAVVFYEPEGPREPDSQHPTSVFDIAERFRSQVRQARFRKLTDDAPGQLTISGGLATFPWDGATAEALVERADQLALESKRQGKNVIAIGPGCHRLGRE